MVHNYNQPSAGAALGREREARIVVFIACSEQVGREQSAGQSIYSVDEDMHINTWCVLFLVYLMKMISRQALFIRGGSETSPERAILRRVRGNRGAWCLVGLAGSDVSR